METETKLREFLMERFGNFKQDIKNRESLDGVIDSMGIFELVDFLEQEFSIKIPNEEFKLERFSSIDNILNVVNEFRISN